MKLSTLTSVAALTAALLGACAQSPSSGSSAPQNAADTLSTASSTYQSPTAAINGTYTVQSNQCNGASTDLELSTAAEGTSVTTDTVTVLFDDGMMSLSTTYSDGCAISQVTQGLSAANGRVTFADSSTYSTCNAMCAAAECVEDTQAHGAATASYKLSAGSLTFTQPDTCGTKLTETDVMTLKAR